MSSPSWTRFEAGFYEMFSKVGWSLAVSWVTIACTKGYGGPVAKFLSWGLFQPFAKLSFMAYLVHLGALWAFAYSRTYSIEFSHFDMVR